MTQRICFVTIGATAAFDQLLHAVLTSQFLQTLRASGYTNLLLQYGTAGYSILKSFEAEVASGEADNHGIDISGFDFNKLGLGVEMSLVKAAEDRAEGVVISHAGNGGTLLGGWHLTIRTRINGGFSQVLARSSTLCALTSP